MQLSRLGVDRALRRLLAIQGVGSAAILIVGGAALARGCRLALRPLSKVVALAVRVRDGLPAGRLRPTRVDTEIGALAQALDSMLDAQELALGQARASDERSHRFLADAAHQLASPITTIQATAETLSRARSDEEQQQQLLGVLLGETSRAGALLVDLRRLAQLESDRPLEFQPLDVPVLVQHEVERAAGLAPHLAVHRQADSSVTSSELPANQEMLRAAVGNLLDNARRHARCRIQVTVHETEDHLSVTVYDDGPGLSPGDEERAFERCSSLDGMGGSGLGLAIARTAARAHEGDLTFEDGRFVLRLGRRTGTSAVA